jgi:hypothetical protein
MDYYISMIVNITRAFFLNTWEKYTYMEKGTVDAIKDRFTQGFKSLEDDPCNLSH